MDCFIRWSNNRVAERQEFTTNKTVKRHSFKVVRKRNAGELLLPLKLYSVVPSGARDVRQEQEINKELLWRERRCIEVSRSIWQNLFNRHLAEGFLLPRQLVQIFFPLSTPFSALNGGYEIATARQKEKSLILQLVSHTFAYNNSVFCFWCGTSLRN